MERNNIIAFILIFMTMIMWSYMNQPSQAEIDRQTTIQDSIALVSKQVKLATIAEQDKTADAMQEQAVTISDSARQLQNTGIYGSFAPAAIGSSKTYTLENPNVKIEFSNKGGNIISAHLKDYKSSALVDGEDIGYTPLYFMNDGRNRFNYKLSTPNVPTRIINTEELYFTPTQSGNSISFKAKTSDGGYIEQSYTLADDGYNVDYDLNLVGMNQHLDTGRKSVTLEWDSYLNRLEKNNKFEQTYSTVYFRDNQDEDVDYCRCVSDADEDLSEDKIDWIANVNQFFNTSLISTNTPFTGGKFETKMIDQESDSDKALKLIKSEIEMPYDQSANQSITMKMYIGPNKFENLKEYGVELEEIIPYGTSIFGSINRWFIRPFFGFLSGFIGSKGIVILVLIFLIKMALYPLMYKMLASQAKMGALKPEIAKLTEKYKEEPQKKQMETMKIYQQYSVSPFGGCMPMIAQMPIWYAMFRFFPASIEFRQEPFLWATDLSSYDVFFQHGVDIPFLGNHISLFTLLWAATTLIYTYYNTKHMDMSANPAMKYVQYFMPVMFLGFFNSYASGLTTYMFFSNLINILQTVITKKFVFDDEKILSELNIQKEKPKKKNSFAQRLQEQMRQAQAVQEQQAKAKNKGKK
ncbi:MAG: membrane protein insertase YidC [Saprospiraceae bacterium]|jgi:YidC/Oxa1 family membrane protein insertase|nr:membrane protein insertase YidC [Saprospiraceae bacterium]